jgi:2-polyprenyl-3-methyl-5-hydroxy-6-metoxy-1,4-benzoquinol methylase
MNRGSIASFDPIWERLYSDGRHVNRYPFDEVVAFLFRHFPKEELRKKTNVLEVGFGAANNLWFAAREGFTVAGVESSTTAVRIAQRRFEEEKLRGDLRVGNFIQLPFGNDVFDVGINRAALTRKWQLTRFIERCGMAAFSSTSFIATVRQVAVRRSAMA